MTWPRLRELFTIRSYFMAYNSRHSIFLQDNDKQKLMFIKSLFDEDGICFVIKEEAVYQYDGEPLSVTCLSDINWNSGNGYVWYDFEYDMERISEKFNRKYPNDVISVYVKTEDGFENLYEFQGGSMSSDEDIIHYQTELQKVCEELNPHTILLLFSIMEHILSSDIIYTKSIVRTIGLLKPPLPLLIQAGTTTTSQIESKPNRFFTTIC